MNRARARASNPPGGAAQNPVAKDSTAHAPGSIFTRDAFSVRRPPAFPVTYFPLAEPLTCGRSGSTVPGRVEKSAVARLLRHFVNMSHLPMKLLRKKIEKRNLKLRQRNLKLQGEMR